MKVPLWRRGAAALAALPLELRIVLLAAAVLHGVGIGWGLPASDAWDNDGVAPRDFLPGLADTFTPGHYYTYPPFHLALLTLLSLPELVIAIIRAGALSISSVLPVILGTPYMTAMALTARVLAVVMSLGIILTLALIAAELVPAPRRRAVMVLTAAFASVNRSFDYYAHMSNLDVPYLFWALLATLFLVRAIARGEPRRLRYLALFGALAITTKDQAYAMFLVGVPLSLALSVALDRAAPKKALAREAGIAAAIAIGLVLLIDGALFNPSGFRARLGFLSGSASQDYATYSRDTHGRLLALRDVVLEWHSHYPPVLGVLLVGGLVVTLYAARRAGRNVLVASLVPLVVAVSFTLCFNLVARRVEERFTLPQMLLASVYAGLALEELWSATRHRLPVRAACVGLLGYAGWQCVVLDANLLLEPRYGVEGWLAAHAGPNDLIEVHGLNVYLPRFSPPQHVIRVGPTPPEKRSPLPQITEVQDLLMNIEERRPRFIVMSHCYVWRYLKRDVVNASGHIIPTVQVDENHDRDPTTFFQDLWEQRLNYRVVFTGLVRSTLFPRQSLHASVGCPVDIWERQEGK